MEDKKNGYKSKHYDFPTKRYCQTLDLKDDPELIKEYKKRHGQECYWPEIGEGIKSVGILEMEIYLCGNRLFMIVETPLDFDWDTEKSICYLLLTCRLIRKKDQAILTGR